MVPEVGNLNPVHDYFSAEASSYDSRCNRFPLNLLRTMESREFCAVLGDVAGREVLELGAGVGYYTRKLLAAGASHVWAVDFSASMLASLPSARVTPVEADAAVVALGRRFPVIVSAGMLEFVREPAVVLANAARHAEHKGRFVLLVPRRNLFGYCYRVFHRGHGFSISLFDRKWFEASASATGWRLVEAREVFPFTLIVALELA